MAHGPPRVPFSQPRWIYGDTLLAAATGLAVAGAAPLCAIVLCRVDSTWFREQDPRSVLLAALLVGLVLSLLALNAGRSGAAVGAAFAGAPLIGGIAGAVSWGLCEVPPWREISLAACVLGGVVSGAVLAVALAGAGLIAALFRAESAHDGFDRLLGAIGCWLFGLYAAAAWPLRALDLEVVAAAGLGCGGAALLLAAWRLRSRKRWFGRVRAGHVPEWQVREWSGRQGVEGLIPLFGGSALACDALLVHVASAPGNAYRTQTVETVVLLAPGHRGGVR